MHVRAFLLAATAVGLTTAGAARADLRVTDLRCEYATNPVGIDTARPRLTWILQSRDRGQRQTAYEVLVGTSEAALEPGKADLWDSGKVPSDQSALVPYAGKALASRTRCYWRVRAWDKDGRPSSYSPAAFWEMGLLQPSDWKAQWIGATTSDDALSLKPASWIWFPEGNPASSAPSGSRYFRRTFELPAKPAQARVRITCDDRFRLYVNGRDAGRDTGGWEQPQTFDVTGLLTAGRNVLAVQGTNQESAAGLIAVLQAVAQPGAPPTVIATNADWRAANAPADGWQRQDFDDSRWASAMEIGRYGAGPWKTLSTSGGPAPHMRKEFAVSRQVRSARLYATALGVYEAYLNGKRVSDDVFAPGWTDYHKRVQYQTYDLTGLLKPGANALAILLGDGWYAGYVGLGGRNRYGAQPLALAQLEIAYDDGTREVVVTDGSWRAGAGAILASDMLMGEDYDARREVPGWNTAGFRDAEWPAVQTKEVTIELDAEKGPPVRRTQELQPIAITEPAPGHFVFDLGQNMVGRARLRVAGAAGSKVTLRVAEMLNPDGTIYTTNYRGARCIDTYTLKGGGTEVYEPTFTFRGFRYVELTGYPGKPGKTAITGVVLGSDTPKTGTLTAGNKMVAQLQRNIEWGQRGNFLSVPTDCPQRDERLGWMGDAQIFIRTAAHNMDVAGFFTKWLVDVDDAQRPDGAFTDVSPFVAAGAGTAAWGDAGVICPWTVYLMYGDTRIIEEHYPAMVRWIDYMQAHSKGLLRPAEGYGDWLSINADTPRDVLATAYFAYSTRLLGRMAAAIGKDDDARKYEDLFQQVKAAFNEAYVSEDGHIKGNTQTDYVLALRFDLLPEAKRAMAAQYLVDDIQRKDNHLSTGFVGVGYLLPTLTDVGHNDVAYRLLQQDTFPSWGYSIKYGATTIWERWDGWTKERGFQDAGMNSFNHYSLGSVGQWMYETGAGIGVDPAHPGYKHIIVRPALNAPFPMSARQETVYGVVSTELDANPASGSARLRLVVPVNTTATVYLPPAAGPEDARKRLTSDVRVAGQEGGLDRIEVGSGTYDFAFAPQGK